MMRLLRRMVRLKAGGERTIADSYFRGYRRLAPTASMAERGVCWTCKHAVGFVTWHCDLLFARQPCQWERCYAADELSKADLKAGYKNARWIGLPKHMD